MRICFIGDSYVNGTGDDDCLGWPGRICAEARQRGRDITLYNLGIRGNTSTDIAERWEREARARLSPEHDGRLVFSFGVNDCAFIEPGRTRVAETQSVENARCILQRAKEWLPTLMIGPPPSRDFSRDERVKNLSAQFEALCHDLAIPFLSPWDWLTAEDVWLQEAAIGDGVHPNRGGYGSFADLILEWPAWREWVDEPGRQD
ncbi:GDSL-type esterase/lipase family protein [Beijerinckia indica]|uniref:Lipolytic protein G-D-S-L family n=1 Tax=Beijerinckia indica subsp. indica (strain ATCC 9039 / DSM 1715 / NCIMB 8712) TaxID=395963 RepID=B2ICS8_BEII9|nr:GDSL-type esterase/lipase family protein [Beijerinckia indica]ACB95352.1 lipolytic protein G-D-S-L family [Beijerinckia indica subsp. indica ATCC 9039]